jgi:dTDP-4-dehydrorhamnose reductase
MTILVVGGDSRLAREFVASVVDVDIISTTRRHDVYDKIFLDLSDIESFIIPNEIKSAVVVGGVTSYNECVDNYSYAYHVNCVSIPNLIKKLLLKGIHTCFVSTNTVFKYRSRVPTERDTPNPSFAYAEMKYETELKSRQIAKNLNMESLLSILRMTKNISNDTKPFDMWINNFKEMKEITAFTDLYFSPIRFLDAVNMIQVIIKNRLHGIFHLSGERDISYSDFAINLAEYLGIGEEIIRPVKSSDVGVNLVYNHNITALSMRYTTIDTGLKEIQLIDVYKYIKSFL